MILKSDVKFEEKLICCFRNYKNLVNFDSSIQKSQKFALAQVYNIWPKKVQRSYLSWHWRVMQNLKKNWLVVWKITWGIWQIFITTLGSVKIGTFMGSFCPKYKMHELKIYKGVCVMTLKNDAKFEEELTCRFKIDMRNLRNFDPSTRKPQKCALWLVPFDLKKYRGVIFHDT